MNTTTSPTVGKNFRDRSFGNRFLGVAADLAR